MSDYPEHDKMLAVRDQADAIGAFLEWLRSAETPYSVGVWETQVSCEGWGGRWNTLWHCDEGRKVRDPNMGADDGGQDLGECPHCDGTALVDRIEPRLMPAGVGIEQLLAQYLDIDLQKIAEEKDEMLHRIREKERVKIAEERDA